MTRYYTSIGDHIVRLEADAGWIGMWLAFHLQAVESGRLRSPRLIDLQADLTAEIASGGADRPDGNVVWDAEGRHARIAAPDESALARAVAAAYGAFILRREWGLLLRADIVRRGGVAALNAGATDGLALVRIRGGKPLAYDSPFAQGGARPAEERLPLPLSAVHWHCGPGQADIGLAAPADAADRLMGIAVAGGCGGADALRLSLLCRRLAEEAPMYEAAPDPPLARRRLPSIRR